MKRVCILTCSLLVWGNLIAQHDITTLTINWSDTPLRSALEQLQAERGISLYYKAEDIPNVPVTASFENRPVSEVLEALLAETTVAVVTYRANHFVIMPRSVLGREYTISYYEALERSRRMQATSASTSQITIGSQSGMSDVGQATINGRVLDFNNGEPIIGATISLAALQTGDVSDEDGRFQFLLPVGSYDILVKYVGYDDLFTRIVVFGSGAFEIELRQEALTLDEITVTAQSANVGVSAVQIGVAQLDMKLLRKLPALLGEADVVRSLLLNPGVSTVGEGAIGFNVRGGNVDQNLVQQDEGFFFNSSHALGFFSTFNADMISSVELYKGNMPAQFGGRLASALDVELKTGSFEDFSLKAGVGPVTSRLTVEGPVLKDKVSVIAGVRTSYADWFLQQVDIIDVQNSSAYFYDANLKIAIKPNSKSSISLSGYRSEDLFSYSSQFGFDYSTSMAQMTYRQIFSDRMFNRFTIAASSYETAQSDLQSLLAVRIANKIDYLNIKEQLTIVSGTKLRFDTGLQGILYGVDPGNLEPIGDEALAIPRSVERERAIEGALFANVEYNLSQAVSLTAGLRGVLYQFLGPGTQALYLNPEQPAKGTTIGFQTYGQGEVIQAYHSLEPRFSLRYAFANTSSIKMGYSRTAQFINQIFNSDSPTPSSQWQLSTAYIQPNRSHNASIGYFRDFRSSHWETSLEFYGRYIDHLFDFRDFAELFVNDQLEAELLPGVGRAYGTELSLKKTQGVYYGWFSYTLSRTERLVEGINRGLWYPSNFDKTHDLSLVLNYQPNRRNTLTINFNYNTGRPTSPPIGNYQGLSGITIPIYTDRNRFRIPDYHRLDIAYTIGKGYKRDRRAHTSWTFSVYNAYARRNAFSVFYSLGRFRTAQANRLAIIGTAIPSITFNLEIQ